MINLWQTINSLLHRRPLSALPTTSANISLPDCFSSFFTYKISKLHSLLGFNANQHSSPLTDPPSIPPVFDRFTSVTHSSPLTDPPSIPPVFYRFTSVTQDEIIKMILKSPDKQCDLSNSDFTSQRMCKHACTGHNHNCNYLSRHWNISFSLQASSCYPFTKKAIFW